MVAPRSHARTVRLFVAVVLLAAALDSTVQAVSGDASGAQAECLTGGADLTGAFSEAGALFWFGGVPRRNSLDWSDFTTIDSGAELPSGFRVGLPGASDSHRAQFSFDCMVGGKTAVAVNQAGQASRDSLFNRPPQFFPNPVQDGVTTLPISVDTPCMIHVSIFDGSGRAVPNGIWSFGPYNWGGFTVIDCRNLSSGVYLVQVSAEEVGGAARRDDRRMKMTVIR